VKESFLQKTVTHSDEISAKYFSFLKSHLISCKKQSDELSKFANAFLFWFGVSWKWSRRSFNQKTCI